MKMQVRIDERIFEVSIDDISARPIKASVEGTEFEVWPEEVRLSPVQQTAIPVSRPATPVQPKTRLSGGETPAGNENAVKAPIPGVIIDITAKPGDAIRYGQELCVLEAMKMKNSIRAGRDGIIDQVLISIGDQVNQNQVLMVFRKESK